MVKLFEEKVETMDLIVAKSVKLKVHLQKNVLQGAIHLFLANSRMKENLP